MRRRSFLEPTFSISFAADAFTRSLQLAAPLPTANEGFERDALFGSPLGKGFKIGGAFCKGRTHGVIDHIRYGTIGRSGLETQGLMNVGIE
jgi:hypothetical protein